MPAMRYFVTITLGKKDEDLIRFIESIQPGQRSVVVRDMLRRGLNSTRPAGEDAPGAASRSHAPLPAAQAAAPGPVAQAAPAQDSGHEPAQASRPALTEAERALGGQFE